MKNKNCIKKIFSAAALIILSAATVSCGTNTNGKNPQKGPNENLEPVPEKITVKDGEYSLVHSSEDNTYKAVNYYSILNGFYGDGKTDDSQNLQNLLNKASENGGTVYLPKGLYRLEKNIVIPSNVTLTGDFASPRSSSGIRNSTVFVVAETESTLKNPLFSLNDGSKLTEITVYYEGQSYGDVKNYPYTVVHDSGKTAEISKITIFNAANGIKLASNEAETVEISNVFMTAVNNGIYALFCSDKLEITDVFIDPSLWFNCELDTKSLTENGEKLTEKISSELTAVILTATSDIYVDSVKVNTCKTGVRSEIPYITEKTPLLSNITVSGASEAALLLESAPKTGIAFAKCSFRTNDSYGSKDVKIEASYTSPAVFNSCSFKGSPSYSVYSEGSSFLSFVGCEFISWKESAIYSSDRVFSVTGGSFNSVGDIVNAPASTAGIFALNHSVSDFSPEETSVFVADTNNEYTVNEITDTWFEDLTSEFGINSKIYNAEDFGVSSSEPNSSMALQMAINMAAENGGGTVFVDEGTFTFTDEIKLKKGVRLQGVGRDKTVLRFSKSESGVFLNLEGSNKLEGLTVEYTGSETPEEASESPVKAVYGESNNIELSNVGFSKVHYALYLSDASNIIVEDLFGSAVIGGIYAELCDFMYMKDIEFTKNGLSEEVVSYQHEKFVAVMIRECTGSLFENLSSDNGDYLLYLNSEKVDVVPEEPTIAAMGLFAENVYSAFAINKYDFAAVVNISADTEIFGKNAYHATTFAGNRGKLCVYNLIGKGNVTGGIYLRGGDVSVQSCIFNTCGPIGVKNEGATAEVAGCIFLDKGVTYHAESGSGTMSFIANIIDSNAEFAGTEKSYTKSYSSADALFTSEFNMIPINGLS
ncbi:MAG: hypothetical protein IJE40_04605 [Clostridia bacterium]|nr:hypothetical protein [Clostridia bacterium]